jgi:uncharacterized membrane protein
MNEMTLLVVGLLVFLGMHSARIVAEDARNAFIARRGLGVWKGLYTLVSAVGLVLIVIGYGQARAQPVALWDLQLAGRYAGSALALIAFVFFAAVYVPRNAIKARLHHPMVLGTKLWALGHLLANGTLADLVLFGAFLLWSALSFRAARARDRAAGTSYPAGDVTGTLIALVVGLALGLVFMLWLHAPLIGVRPI